MKFMLLVKASRDSEAGLLPDSKFRETMSRFNEEMARAGALLGAEGLKPSSEGARVRANHGEITVTDGPLTRAKDLVAGYWVIEARSKEEAVDWAKRAPFEEGEVEVRPMIEMGDQAFWKSQPPPPGKFRYMSFVFADPATESGTFTIHEEVAKNIQALVVEMVQKGVFLGTGGLYPSSRAARVRYAGKKRTVIDGPFAEAKELVGGFALLQASSKAEMIEHAKRFALIDAPGRHQGICDCEVRPLYEASDFT